MSKLGTPQNILPSSFELLGNQRSGSTERADYSHLGKCTGLHSACSPGSHYRLQWGATQQPEGQAPLSCRRTHCATLCSKAPLPSLRRTCCFTSSARVRFHRECPGHPGTYRAVLKQTWSLAEVWRPALSFKSRKKPVRLQIWYFFILQKKSKFIESNEDPND